MKHIAIVTALLSILCPAQEPATPAAREPMPSPPATETDQDKFVNQSLVEIMRRLHFLEESMKREKADDGQFINPLEPSGKRPPDAVSELVARAEYDDARTRYEYQLDLLKQLQAKLAESETDLANKGPSLTEAGRSNLEKGIEKLKGVIRTQEETVEQERKLLAQIVRAKGHIFSKKNQATDDAGNRAGTPAEPDAILKRLDRIEQALERLNRRLDAMDARAKVPHPKEAPADEHPTHR